MATASSSIIKIINIKLIGFIIKIVDLRRAIRMWPAVKLAASRTERVIGRIIWLTLSINTINCERKIGVDNGTKWLSAWFQLRRILNIKNPSQKGRIRERATDRWAVIVNT